MREIALDTETTGLDPAAGHKVVEIGCLELMNHTPTGRTFHAYINPERDMPPEAESVHGLSAQFLSDKPVFAAVVEEFLAFVGDAPIVAHNAPFDMGFINAELAKTGRDPLPADRAIDTVVIARRKFPGAPANLDALCKRFQIDTSARSKYHGALVDAELLAKVYLELVGGREPGLALAAIDTAASDESLASRPPRPPRPHAPTAAEATAHAAFIARLKDPVWLRGGGDRPLPEALEPSADQPELEEAD